jgi:hypothetical protein
VPAELIADIQVWRAAIQADPSDLRPTGPLQLGNATRIFQQQLDKRLAAADTRSESRWRQLLAAEIPAVAADPFLPELAESRWRQLLAAEIPAVAADPFLPELAERLNNLARAGFDASLLVRSAAAAGPLPDDHPAAALWWRLLNQLPQTPNPKSAPSTAVPATRQRTTTPPEQRRPRPRSAPPPALGPSR